MKLDNIFSSHMVFAANKPIRIYGTGDGTAEIGFAGMTRKAVSHNGKWSVELPAMEYGGPYELSFAQGDEKIVLDDIYIGKVFLFAGQSNMQFKLESINYPESDYKTNDLIRVFSTSRLEDTDRFKPCDGWVTVKREYAKDLSAIGYITAGAVQERDGIAVGAVMCYQGASIIESWVPRGTYEKMGIDVPIEKKHIDHVNELFTLWNKEGILYEYAFSQVVPFSFSAIVWYQGESDSTVEEAAFYEEELKKLIEIWREDLCDPELHFVVIQVADYAPRNDDGWRAVQEAQIRVAEKTCGVSLAVSRDVCEQEDIHPRNKKELSLRVANLI